jgi:isopentenyl-diphosphate delta-isomerase
VTEPIMIPTWKDGLLQPFEKLAAHKHGLRHKAISVFVIAGNKTLIQQRALSKYHTPGLWANTCCTHPQWGEQADFCALRRLNEELGINGLIPRYRGQVEYRAEVGSGLIEHEVVEVFVCDTDEALALDLNPNEVMATRWVDMAELQDQVVANPDAFTPWLAIYLSKHSSMIFATEAAE